MLKTKLKSFITNHGHFILAFILALWAFHRWFGSGTISWGDWWPESLDVYFGSIKFDLWSGAKQFGGSMLNEFSAAVWLPSFSLAGLLAKIGLSYAWIEKLIWFWPYVIIAPFSYYYFWRTFFPDKKSGLLAGILFFIINTYSMLLTMGGHINLSVVYALTPTILALVKKYSETRNINTGIILGLFVSLAVTYEIRGVILLTGLILIYFVCFWRKIGLKNIFWTLLLYGGVPIFLNLWWIIPFALQRHAEILPATYDQVKWVKESSYANFSHAITFFHPQWYNNILGEINPIPLIFFLLPLILIPAVFYSQKDYRIRFFTIMSIMAIFLIKGANNPLGDIYVFLFQYFPGFKAFRDPSKFNFFLGFSYSVLFGYLAAELYKNSVKWAKIGFAVITILPIIWLWPVYSQKIHGTFSLIAEATFKYQQFEQFLKNDKNFARTLWIPKKQRFAYFSENHPIVSTDEAIHNSMSFFKNETMRTEDSILNPLAGYLLPDMGVGYVVIPSDDTKDIYKDYLPKGYYEDLASKQSWLTKNTDLKLSVYEIKNHEDVVYTRDHWIFVNEINSKILKNYLETQKQKLAVILASPNDKVLKSKQLLNNQSHLFTKKYPINRKLSKKTTKIDQGYGVDNELISIQVPQKLPFKIFIPTEIATNILQINLDEHKLTGLQTSSLDQKYYEVQAPAVKPGLHNIIIKRRLSFDLFNVPYSKNYQDYNLGILRKDCQNIELTNLGNLSESNKILKIRSFDKKENCLAKRIKLPESQLDKTTDYLLSFKTQRLYGKSINIYIETSGGQIIQPTLPNYFSAKKYENEKLSWWTQMALGKNNQYVTIFLAYPDTIVPSESWLSEMNLKQDDLKKTKNTDILWGNLNNITDKKQSQVAKITKNSNSATLVDIQNATTPHLVILNKQYNPDWEAKIGKKEQLNVITNGFANGFFVDKPGNYQLKIDFRLNQYILPGSILSLLSLAGLFVILIINLINKRKNKKSP